MEFFRRWWAQIRAFLDRLSIAERWLIVTLAALLVAVGVLVLQYAARPQLVPISAFATQRQAEAIAKLRQAGIRVVTEGGQIKVPVDQETQALVVLQQANLMDADTSAAFDQLIARQNPWLTNEQNRQQFLIAKMKVLEAMIRKMAGVRNAWVVISPPEDRGFGRQTIRPSATVSVEMEPGKRIDKAMVQALAGLVAGAVAEMQPQDVVVVDTRAGRQYTVRSDLEAAPGEALELVQQLEEYHRSKISDLLSYIPGVIVAVSVQLDPTRTRQVEQVEFEKTEPLRRERSRETERRDTTDAGAPGPRSNLGLEIEGAAAAGSMEKTTETESEFGPKQPVRKVSAIEAGHSVQQINVTVNVPRSYFVRLFKAGKPEAPEPDDTQLAPIVQQQLQQIQQQIEPLILAAGGQGVVRACMIPDPSVLTPLAQAGMPGSGGVGMILDSNWIKPLGLGLLALVSLGIMLGMARKATQAPPLPSAEELAGVPPPLPVEEDELIGEAEESQPSLTGIELDEQEIRHRKIAQQIADMIKSNPTEAAQLLRRWVHTEV